MVHLQIFKLNAFAPSQHADTDVEVSQTVAYQKELQFVVITTIQELLRRISIKFFTDAQSTEDVGYI